MRKILDKNVYRVYDMNMEENKRKKVIEKYLIVTEKIFKTGNFSDTYGTDVEIYTSEIHIIHLIGYYNDIHISEIARKLGVTRGAISKSIKKLEKKKLVYKAIDKTNSTRTLIKLTDKGIKAYLGHERYHNEYDEDMFLYLESLKEHELDMLVTFLEMAGKMAEKHV